MSHRYVIGIDLGTTNSVLAYADVNEEKPRVHVLPIPQWTAIGERESRSHLPSFLYFPMERERETFVSPDGVEDALNGSSVAVSAIAGVLAMRQSAEFADRTVASAKSWLCHQGVDRQSGLLPWEAGQDITKISPVTASAAYLRHLIQAWNSQFPDSPFRDQWVSLTVPASFDMTARELTRMAAMEAGMPDDFVMLEEPQAAAYHWIQAIGDQWRQSVSPGDRILVCDIGGGTTDLTLLVVEELNGELQLRRQAVGQHLLVGGDNMDLALAHFAASRFEERGTRLNAWQSISLWHACRAAKEVLLGVDPPETYTLSVLGRGSKLIGGTVSIELTRREVESLLVDGFFPSCPSDAIPQRDGGIGFQELGLPYEQDSAITRHIAHFMATELIQVESPGNQRPLRVLFNGGACKANAFRQRLLEVVAGWKELVADTGQLAGPMELDLAVACGAAYYGWAKHHGGVRVRGGTARSYYVGIETSGLAVPGMRRPIQALCVVPFGMEEGTESDVPGREVGLVIGKPARFRFFASANRKQDKVGDTLRHWEEDELVETSPLEWTLPAGEGQEQGFVSVRFHSKVTELGSLELWCQSQRDERAWKLEFNVRLKADN